MLFTEVWRPGIPETDDCSCVTSLCRVVKLPVMEVILDWSVFTLFCRLATAWLALVAAVAAACALLETPARDVDMPEIAVLRVLPHVVTFFPTAAMLLESPAVLVWTEVNPV